MTTQEDINADFARMHRELTDPEEREKRRQANERAKRIEERKTDTGIYVAP